MAVNVVTTPRDRLQRLVDYAIRARRYWWLVGIFVVVGGALSVAFAMTRPKAFESSASLFYQERIQTSLLQGRDAVTMQRNIGERYRELLLARSQLAQIIEDPEVNPYPDVLESDGVEAAVEELRLAVSFDVRGANTFRIRYQDADPDRAQAVTAKLTDLLIAKERDLRLEQATATVEFAQQQLNAATADLLERQRARAQFLYDHPEFAEDESLTGEGAAIRKSQETDDQPTSAPRGATSRVLSALRRQQRRIEARLAAADGAPAPVVRDRTPSAAERDAQRAVDAAEDEVRQAQREVVALRDRKLTDNHPDMIRAKERVNQAQQRLKRAEAELAAASVGSSEPIAPPSSAAERTNLERELREVRQQINAEESRLAGRKVTTPAPPPKTDVAAGIVQLETEWARLRREVAEQEERVQTLNDSVFRAQLDAQTRIAEQGSALQVVDPAYVPQAPLGKGKKMLVLAGLVVFTGLGLAIAVGLAILDDRLYRRVDVEQLGVAPVLAVIPRLKAGRGAAKPSKVKRS
jgi:uncharacterized protein involved in exopolysaccharide biosynthesis